MRSVLLIGYGNPGRRDDGLGPQLAAELEGRGLSGLTVDSDYQLTVEDADSVARHEVAVFADAAVTGTEPFYFRRLAPGGTPGFSSHSVEPAEVLALSQTLFNRLPEAYVLGIRGYDFNEFGEGLSGRARANLARAAAFIERVIRAGTFAESECGEAVS
jgi:hydrogenase maturation protease